MDGAVLKPLVRRRECRRIRFERDYGSWRCKRRDHRHRFRNACVHRERDGSDARSGTTNWSLHLERLVDPVTRGDPQSPLRWTCKSTTQLANELTRRWTSRQPEYCGAIAQSGWIQSAEQSQNKRRQSDHPDRNAQFEHINARVRAFQERDQPVISVDTKKKELIGNFQNGGREWRPKGEPERCSSTISWTRNWARPSLTASTMLRGTRGG